MICGAELSLARAMELAEYNGKESFAKFLTGTLKSILAGFKVSYDPIADRIDAAKWKAAYRLSSKSFHLISQREWTKSWQDAYCNAK